jgi:4-hydroxybenzoate polyprenyltransferase
MKNLNIYFRLFRVQNLLIIALLMYFVRYFLLKPVYELENLQLQTDGMTFFLFVLGYVILAAGGYAINDYYDIGMDEINRPDKTILRNHLPLSFGRNAYFVLTFAGVIISIWAILRIGTPKLVFVVAIVTMLYWFYTTKYKREFLTGNLAVAFLAALGTGIVWLYEFFASVHNGILPLSNYKSITAVVLAYSCFAFFLTLTREIIKDIADTEGDKEFGSKTLPIVLGNTKTKIVLYIIQLILLIGIAFCVYYFYLHSYLYMLIFSALIIIMLIVFSRKLMRAETRKDFLFLSEYLKIVFLAGILSLQLYYIDIR